MAIVTAARPGRSGSRTASHRYLVGGVAGALLAAALGYLLHHLPPLQDHPVEGVVAAVFVAAVTAFAAGAFVGRPGAYELPAVLIASASGLGVRRLRQGDLDFCAALHAQSLPHGFFAQLGPRFLRAYYDTFIDSPHAVGLAAIVAGQPVGSLVGILDARSHARWLLRHRGVALAFHAGAGMAVRPRAAFRFARTRAARYARAWRRHRGADSPKRRAPEGAPAVLSHVAVLTGARGLGAGRMLVRAFEDEAQSAGAARAILTTLQGPAGAGRFYERLGWRWSATHLTPDGGHVEEWMRELQAVNRA
jgi:ribosomal protein S18 acetylase RimI-like enzyme